MAALSNMELTIAEQYCRGFTDKEVAAVLDKPIWTIRTHKKRIHGKLGISTTHELVLYMVARATGRLWDVKALRERGLSAVLCITTIASISVYVGAVFFQRGQSNSVRKKSA